MVSICIVNWNTKALLRDCLESVRGTCGELVCEILVADNASTDGSAEMVEAEFPEAVLVRNEANLGFARANNILIEQSRGEYILLLNSDAQLLDGTLEHLIQFMETHPHVGACSPRLLNSDGREQLQGHPFPSVGGILRTCVRSHFPPLGRFVVANRRESLASLTRRSQVDFVSGACLLVRRSALDQVGLLNDQLFFYGEEADLCVRLAENEWQVWHVPEVSAIHLGGESSKQNRNLDGSWELLKGKISFIRRHRGLFSAMAGLALMAGFFFWSLLANMGRLVLLFPFRGNAAGEVRQSCRRMVRTAELSWTVLRRM